MTIKENQDRDFDFDEHLEADFLVSSAGVCMRNLGTLPVDFYVSSLGVCVRNPEAEALDAFNRQPVTDTDFEELPSSPPRPVPPPFTPSISTDDLLARTRDLLARTRDRLAQTEDLLARPRRSRDDHPPPARSVSSDDFDLDAEIDRLLRDRPMPSRPVSSRADLNAEINRLLATKGPRTIH